METAPQTVLIISSDNELNKVLLKSLAEDKTSVKIVTSLKEALEVLPELTCSLIAIYLDGPLCAYLEGIRAIRVLDNCHEVFILTISDPPHQDYVLDIFKSGANACVGKPKLPDSVTVPAFLFN